MKKLLVSILLALLMLASLAVFIYAQDGGTASDDPPECLGEPLEAYLMAGQTITAGQLIVCNDATHLYISYVLDEQWRLSDSHVQIDVIGADGVTGTLDLADYPVNKKGTPVPGQFDYQMDYDPTVTASTYTIPLANIIDGWDGTNYDQDLLIAAHATLGDKVTNDVGTDPPTSGGDPFETELIIDFPGDQILGSSLTVACVDDSTQDVAYDASLNGTALIAPVIDFDFSDLLLTIIPTNTLAITPTSVATCTVEASVVTPGTGEETAWAYDATSGGEFGDFTDTKRWSAFLVYSLNPPLQAEAWPSPDGTLSLAFEDSGDVDYDYNDWVIDLKTVATYELGVTRLDFEFLPEARGAEEKHVFHMHFPAGVFSGTVNATLTVYYADDTWTYVDADGIPIPQGGDPIIQFEGSAGKDFTVISTTMEALPRHGDYFWLRYTNTVEPIDSGVTSHFCPAPTYVCRYVDVAEKYMPPQVTATLSLQLAPGDDFELPSYDTLLADDWFGADLAATFFDPYIYVIDLDANKNETGHTWYIPDPDIPSPPDVRRLVVPTDWLWQEASVHIADEYSQVSESLTETFWFSIEWVEQYELDLNAGKLSPGFREEFKSHGFTLADDIWLTIVPLTESEWSIAEPNRTFIVRKEDGVLKIHSDTNPPVFSNSNGAKWWTTALKDPYTDGDSTIYQGKLLYYGEFTPGP